MTTRSYLTTKTPNPAHAVAPTNTIQTRAFGPQTHSSSAESNAHTQLVHAEQLGHDLTTTLPIQAKLTIGAPNDPYEQEADRVAAQVVQQINSPQSAQQPTSQEQQPGAIQRESDRLGQRSPVQTAPSISRLQRQERPEEEEELQMKPALQRQEGPEEEEELQMKPALQRQERPEEEEELQMKPALQRQEGPEEEEELQMKPALQRQERPEEEEELQTKSLIQRLPDKGGVASANVESSINTAKGNGQPLDDGIRSSMEQAFDANFRGVRVHTDAQSDQLNQSLQARAFTTGQDIFFRQGEFQPGDRTSQELLAHELTHVIQQTGTVQRKPDITPTPSPAIQRVPAALAGIGAALSTEAAANATAVVTGVLGGAISLGETGNALAPGSTGVQSARIPNNWMSETDKLDLELITQFRLINAYVNQWVESNPDASVESTTQQRESSTTFTTEIPEMDGTRTTESTTVTTEETGPAQEGGEVNQAIMSIVKTSVQRQLQQELDNNEQFISPNPQEYIWTDDNAHTTGEFGTIGAVQFTDVRGTRISETLSLNLNASRIPNLSVPGEGEQKTVTQIRGGALSQGPSMATGWNDNLAINIVGDAPDPIQGGHGSLRYHTKWHWDGNATDGFFTISVDSSTGAPTIVESWSGEPDDFSWA